MGVVTVSAVSNVVPATPTKQPCWAFLSNFDLMLYENTFTKQVYYYKPDAPLMFPFNVLVSKLKESLSIALVDYYVLAGRVQHAEDGRFGVNCNDGGVTFREARTEARFDDWEVIQDCSIEDELNTPDCSIEDYAQAPIIQIQVTQFGCGGIAIGYAVSELVVDGYSTIEFMKSWSEVHRGLPISTPPVFNPELLKARSPPTVKVPIRDYIASATPLDESGSLNYKLIDPSLYEHRVFIITSDKIDALIHEIESGPYGYGRATSFEAMSALVWKCMTEARDLPDDATTKFVYTMSLRNNKRWDPPIPANYFGNAVHVPCLPANAGDIKSKHMSYAARLIHEDIFSITTETIKSAIDWMQIQLGKGLDLGYNCDFYCGKDVDCTSIHTFPIYDADFGWGRPLYYSLIVHPWFGDGVAFMLPTREGGRNRQISVQMPGAQMKKLLCSDFVSFATLINKAPSNQSFGH